MIIPIFISLTYCVRSEVAATVGVGWESVMEMYQTFVTTGANLLPPRTP